MSFFQVVNNRIQKLDIWDMACTKLAVAAFVLMLVKFWPVLTALDWYWYALVWLIVAIRPLYRFFRK